MARRGTVKQSSNQPVRRSKRIKELHHKRITTQANNSPPGKKTAPKHKRNQDKDKQNTGKEQETEEQATERQDADKQDTIKTPTQGLHKPSNREILDNGPSNNGSKQQNTAIPSDKPESPGKKATPISHWAEFGTWPPGYAEKGPERDPKIDVERPSEPPEYFEMTEERPKKRARQSYSDAVKTGKNPVPYSNAYAIEIPNHGMIMDTEDDQETLDDTNQQLCENLLSDGNQIHTDAVYPYRHFHDLLKAAKERNETRLVRDMMPLLVPSAELLRICGNMTGLEGITEEVNAQWKPSATIYGPCPKPDFAAGLRSSAFNEQEIWLLKGLSPISCPNCVTDHMYFPFLVCDVKSANGHMVEAERQVMHYASVALKAIIGLHPKESQKEVLGKILAFSIAFDHRTVKLFGHYASCTNRDARGQIQYHRSCIADFVYSHPNSRNQWTASNFVRKIYTDFVPIHLARIRSALSSFASRSPESSYEVELDADREAPESQAVISRNGQSTILRSAIYNASQMSRLYVEMDEQRKEAEEQRKEADEQRKEADKQRKEADEQHQEELNKRDEELRKLQEQVTALQAAAATRQ